MNPEVKKSLEDVIVNALAQSSFFSGLNPHQLKQIVELCALQEYPQSSQIYRLGDPASDLFVLLSGTVRFTIGIGHREASAGEISHCGEVFGWTSLVETTNARFATAFCMKPCAVLALGGNDLLRLMDQDRDLGYHLMKQLSILISSTLTTFASG